jgi:glycosyltransferase EpsJ
LFGNRANKVGEISEQVQQPAETFRQARSVSLFRRRPACCAHAVLVERRDARWQKIRTRFGGFAVSFFTDLAVLPKISIIIPVYNCAKYLGPALAGVLNQTLREIEVICIDDGSTDGSPAILEDYARRDSRIIVLRQENSGAASARNRGLERASAPYIGFVDGDDFVLPEMYEKMYSAMESHGVDFVECGAEMVFTCPFPGDKEWLRCKRGGKRRGKTENRSIFLDTCRELWKVLFRRDLIDRYAIRFEEGFSSNEDGTFVVSYKSIAQSGYYLDENLYLYFQYENSIMGKARAKTLGARIVEQLKTGETYHNFLVKNGIFEELKFFFWNYYVSCIQQFYERADPGVIKLHGPKTIKAFLSGKDLDCLRNSRYFILRRFQKLPDEKLFDWTKISVPPAVRLGECCRKAVKWLLPYGLAQRLKRRQRKGNCG